MYQKLFSKNKFEQINLSLSIALFSTKIENQTQFKMVRCFEEVKSFHKPLLFVCQIICDFFNMLFVKVTFSVQLWQHKYTKYETSGRTKK